MLRLFSKTILLLFTIAFTARGVEDGHFGSLLCNGTNVFRSDQAVLSSFGNGIGNGAGAITAFGSIVLPVNGSDHGVPDCKGRAPSSGWWFSVTDLGLPRRFQLTSCMKADDDGTSSVLPDTTLDISVYYDPSPKDMGMRRIANSTCSRVQCLDDDTITSEMAFDATILGDTASEFCNDPDTARVSISFVTQPFLDYFVFLHLPTTTTISATPTDTTFMIQAYSYESLITGFVENNMREDAISTNIDEYQLLQFDGTVSGATPEMVPDCSSSSTSTTPTTAILTGVWYRGYPISPGETYFASVCKSRGVFLHVYEELADGSLSCAALLDNSPNSNICDASFRSTNSSLLFFVYGDDETAADFVITFSASAALRSSAWTIIGVVVSIWLLAAA